MSPLRRQVRIQILLTWPSDKHDARTGESESTSIPFADATCLTTNFGLGRRVKEVVTGEC